MCHDERDESQRPFKGTRTVDSRNFDFSTQPSLTIPENITSVTSETFLNLSRETAQAEKTTVVCQ